MCVYSYCYVCSFLGILFYCVILCIVFVCKLLPQGVNPIVVNKNINIIDLAVCGLRFGQKISPISQDWGNFVMHKNVASKKISPISQDWGNFVMHKNMASKKKDKFCRRWPSSAAFPMNIN